MKHLLLGGCLLLGQSSCNSESAAPDGVLVRVRNASAAPFTALSVDTSGGENNYGALAPGQSSGYLSFQKAYRYASVKATVNGGPVSFQPDDYVGDAPLPSGGRYTYVVDVVSNANGTGQSLRMQLETP